MKTKKVINRSRSNSNEAAVQQKIANPVAEPVVPDALKTETPSSECAAEYVPDSGPTVEQEEKEIRRGKAAQKARNARPGRDAKPRNRAYVSPSKPLDQKPGKH